MNLKRRTLAESKPANIEQAPPAIPAGMDQAAQIRAFPPAVMTVAEAALYLGLGERTVEGLIQARQLRAARIARRVRIRREWLDDLLG
jgi:excisionase family DNA binding protein